MGSVEVSLKSVENSADTGVDTGSTPAMFVDVLEDVVLSNT